MGKSVDELAGELYDHYCQAVGGLAFNGDPLPAWSAFGVDPAKRKQADAWRSVARALIAGVIDLS